MGIKVVVDSASDLDEAEAQKYGVTFLPIEVRFGDETFLDGVNLTHKRFFEMLVETDELPKTSQINEFTFSERFAKLTASGDEVIVITISSKLSGTYDNAKRAARGYNGKVYVVDSLNATIGERILLEYCLRLIESGLDAKSIAEKLNKKRHDIRLLALVGTLKYLQKGGRISKATAFAGELLNVKPVVAVVDGEVKLVGKALGSRKGNNLLDKLIAESGIDFEMPYAVAYSGLNDSILSKYLEDSAHHFKEKTDRVPAYLIGSTVGTHVGPGAIAVAYFTSNPEEK